MRSHPLPLALVLGALASAACHESPEATRERDGDSALQSDARVRARDDAEIGEDEEDAATSAADAGRSGGDGGTRPMDAGASPADASDAGSAPRDAAEDAARDASADATPPPPAHTFVYVGGYSNDDGLRVYELNRTSLVLSPIAQSADVGPQPSYLTPSADGKTLYVANEDDGNPGITVLRLDPTTGVPTRIDHEGAINSSFVFSALSPDGKYLLATSYDGGNLAVFPVKPDGSLDPRVDARAFGDSAQAHSVRVHKSGKWAYVPTKGLDSVAQLKFDALTGKLSDNAPATFAAQPSGSFDGPRHIAFSRDGQFAFVILELGNFMYSLSLSSEGALAEADRKAREADNASAGHTGAHVLAHPSANFVYGSNRVSNTLVAYSYDAQGKLTLVGRVPSRGNTPRDFDIDPLGKFLIAANQDSGSIAVFAIEANGSLTAKGSPITGLDKPAAVAIVNQ